MRVVVAGTLYLTRLPSLKPHRSYGMIKLYRPELARSRQWCKHCAPHASAPSPLAAGLRSLGTIVKVIAKAILNGPLCARAGGRGVGGWQ